MKKRTQKRPAWPAVIAIGGAGVVVWLLVRGRSAHLISPVPGDDEPRLTPHGRYGAERTGPPSHTHQGLDLVAPPGSKIVAVGAGQIVAAQPGLGGIVRKQELDRPASWGGPRKVRWVVYADLGAALVEPGDHVTAGQAIGTAAKSGLFHLAVKDGDAHDQVFFDPAEAGLRFRTSRGREVV